MPVALRNRLWRAVAGGDEYAAVDALAKAPSDGLDEEALLLDGRSRSPEVPWGKAALPVSRIAPKPGRWTGRSPGFQVPAVAAVIFCAPIGGVPPTPLEAARPFYGYVYVLRAATAEAGSPRS